MTRTALITGASGGIGRATAQDLGTDHNVVVHYYSNQDAAEAVAETIEDSGQDAITYGCDIGDPDAAAALVDEAETAFDSIDVLVNNAAVFHRSGLADISRAHLEQTLAVNLAGALYVTRAVLPGMVRQEAGRIVNVASTAGTHGSPTDPTYGASKGGLLGFTRSLARCHTADGIFSNCVAPGPTKTKMFEEERRPAARDRSPIDRLIEPTEVAEAIRFFASTSSVSGEVLDVDAGMLP